MQSANNDLATIVCFSSGKGGVGKTCLAVNLAHLLARRGLRVLIADGDLGLANVDILLNLEVQATIREVLERGEDPSRVILEVEPGLAVLPASCGVPELAQLGRDERGELARVLQSLRSRFDFLLVDTAAGIGPDVLWLNRFAAGEVHSVVVLTPEPTSVTDAYALMKVLRREERDKNFHLLVNQVADEAEGNRIFDGLCRVTHRFLCFEPRFLGAVPRDEAVLKALRGKRLFVDESPDAIATRALTCVTDNLLESLRIRQLTAEN